MLDLDPVLQSAMTELERKEQIEIWYEDMRKILLAARDKEYLKIDTGVSNETAGAVKLRFDMYFYYLKEAFKKLQK